MTTEERVMRLFERADPVPDTGAITPPVPASLYLNTLERGTSTVALTTEQTTPGRKRPGRSRLLLAAAASILLIVGLLVISGLRNDSAPADEPAPGTTLVPDPPEAALATSIAEQFIVALGELDTETAIGLVARDAQIQHYGQSGSRAEIPLGIAMEQATGGRTELQECEYVGPHVRCAATWINDRIEAVGGMPGDMTYFIRVDDGMIDAYRVALDADTFGTNPWWDYQTFVSRRGDDFGAMFAGNADGMGIVGPLLTEESVELHRQYTEAFIREHGDSG